MKERPILFSGPMVRAILEGRKGQTRRVAGLVNDLVRGHGGTRVTQTKAGWTVSRDAMHTSGIRETFNVTCPYGVPGDRLWVRESYWIDKTTGEFKWYVHPGLIDVDRERDNVRLRPAIHMPRSLSRVTLAIRAVRVERLGDISHDDIRAEGLVDSRSKFAAWGDAPTLRTQFANLWDSINAKRGYGWDANPWVWVIEFARVEP